VGGGGREEEERRARHTRVNSQITRAAPWPPWNARGAAGVATNCVHYSCSRAAPIPAFARARHRLPLCMK